jgi:NADH dehydrogenase
LVSISHRAVGNLMQVLARSWMIEGRLAKWIYLSLYQSHLIALHGVCYTMYKMIANVFSRRIKPKLKLH